MFKQCIEEGCNEPLRTIYHPRSHKPDADTIEVHFCQKGHMFSVCPRITCCHLRAKVQPWVEDNNKEGQWIHLCDSCYHENSVVKACKTCFEAAGKKTLQKLCDVCLTKNRGNVASSAIGDIMDNRWIFRTRCLKSFEQCTIISSDDKHVKVRRVSDKKDIKVDKRIRSSQTPLAIRMGCKVIENKRRGQKRQCECQSRQLSAWQTVNQRIGTPKNRRCTILAQTEIQDLPPEDKSNLEQINHIDSIPSLDDLIRKATDESDLTTATSEMPTLVRMPNPTPRGHPTSNDTAPALPGDCPRTCAPSGSESISTPWSFKDDFFNNEILDIILSWDSNNDAADIIQVARPEKRRMPALSPIRAKQTRLEVGQPHFEWPKSFPKLLRIFSNFVMSCCA